MKVRDVMHNPVLTLAYDTPYEEAANFLLEKNIKGCPVVNDNGDVIGMISDKDLYRVLFPFYRSFYESPELYTDPEKRESKIEEIRKNPIERFMTREIVSVTPDTAIMSVGAIMLARGINRMPVMDESGKLVGIVTRGDIYKTIIHRHLEKK